MSPEFLLLSSNTNYKSFFRNQKTYFWRKLQSICEYLFSFNEILIFNILQTNNITIKEKNLDLFEFLEFLLHNFENKYKYKSVFCGSSVQEEDVI